MPEPQTQLTPATPKTWEQFDKLSEQQTIDMFAEHLLDAVNFSSDEVESLMRARLLRLTIHTERNRLKKQWQEALLNNKEKFSQNPLVAESQTKGNTVSAWLRYYLSIVGYELADTAARQQFLSNDQALRVLNDDEKKRLGVLIGILEFTKRDSTTPEGFEEEVLLRSDDGKVSVMRDGVTEEIDERLLRQAKELAALDTTPGDTQESAAKTSMKKVFLGSDEERSKIRAIQEELLNQKAVLRDELMHAIQTKNVQRAHAAMKLMTQRGTLLTALSEDKRVVKWTRRYISKRFSEKAQLGFQGTFFDPVYTQQLLRMIYEQQLNASPYDATRFAAQIEALLIQSGRTEFRGMVQVDPQNAQFTWADVQEQNGTLSLKE